MSITEAIEFVRLLLDESADEYFEPDDIRRALSEAQVTKLRECWARGDREAVRLLWTVSSALTSGDAAPAALFYDACLLKISASSARTQPAVFIEAHEYVRGDYEHSPENRSGRYEYSVADGKIYHNGITATLYYYALPEITGATTDFLTPEYLHGAICDRAASLLYAKEVPQQERPTLGEMYDLEAIFMERMRPQQ